MKTATTATASTTPVSLRFVGRIVSAKATDVVFDSDTLRSDSKARVAFLRNAASFALTASAQASKFRSAIRVGISKPHDPAAQSAAQAARIGIAAINAQTDGIAAMFLAVPALEGQEITKDEHGNTVAGRHLATAMFGAETVAASRAMLRRIEC